MADLPTEPTPPIETRRVLTPDELMVIWQKDEFWGLGGSYIADTLTGKRTLKED